MATEKSPLSKGTNTVEHAATVFGALLFPQKEGQDGDEDLEVVAPGEHTTQNDEGVVDDAPPADADDPDADPDNIDAQPQRKTVKVKDAESQEEIEVDEEEKDKGYLRLQDYTRKTQHAADLRKQAEAELEDARKAREEYANRLSEASNWYDAMLRKEPDWAALRQKTTPDQYLQVREQWDSLKTEQQKVLDEQAKVEADRQKELSKQYEAYVAAEEEKLLDAVPEWQDPKTARKELGELGAWLKDKGYAEEQIASLKDHRLVISLRNAMLFEKARTASPKPTVRPRGSNRVVAPGSPADKAKPQTEYQRDMARLKKSGKQSDAARVFQHFVE